MRSIILQRKPSARCITPRKHLKKSNKKETLCGAEFTSTDGRTFLGNLEDVTCTYCQKRIKKGEQ